MPEVAAVGASAEEQFAALVETLAADPGRRAELCGLLREDHAVYEQRGTAATVRMRGWVLLALARGGLADDALVYVLEELDTGTDAYLLAAAARALRSYPSPDAAFAPFVARALARARYYEEPVSFERYGEYALSQTGTSPLGELFRTLEWLGPRARGVLAEVEELRAQFGGLPRKLRPAADRAIESVRGRDAAPDAEACCTLPGGLGGVLSWERGSRRACGPIEQTAFEDQDGTPVTFGEFFRGRPSVVVFFYTRCDNPLKCSLTITKLGRVQKLLEERGLAGEIQTAAITYDPEFDLPERLRCYGQNRGVRTDACHRLLRVTGGFEALRRHFQLGVNFIGSLVNRHRIEVYLLDEGGRIAASFSRIHWGEEQVAARAAELHAERSVGEEEEAGPPHSPNSPKRRKGVPALLTAFTSLAVAFFPKCPICWAAYLSLFGIAGLQRIPYAPWLQPLLVVVMLINLGSLWLRGRATGRMGGFYLVGAGALTIILSKAVPGWGDASVWGVVLTLAGSLLSALGGGFRLSSASARR
ncbi:MAG: SCO family protein [Acidobacteria bacterium]|nr:SCO family protein [Acidobacteriota bacterium]